MLITDLNQLLALNEDLERDLHYSNPLSPSHSKKTCPVCRENQASFDQAEREYENKTTRINPFPRKA